MSGVEPSQVFVKKIPELRIYVVTDENFKSLAALMGAHVTRTEHVNQVLESHVYYLFQSGNPRKIHVEVLSGGEVAYDTETRQWFELGEPSRRKELLRNYEGKVV